MPDYTEREGGEPTPGNWHVGGKDATIIFDDATGYAIADAKTFHGKHGGLVVCQANARLMAIAPELARAMEGIDHFSDALNYRDDPLSVALRQWIDAGRLALAKSRGGSQ